MNLQLIATIATLIHIASTTQTQWEPVDEDNIRRFMSLRPDELQRTLQLLEDPAFAAALVNEDKRKKGRPIDPNYRGYYGSEENARLIERLIGSKVIRGRLVKKPEDPELKEAWKGIVKDPILWSFFAKPIDSPGPINILPSPYYTPARLPDNIAEFQT